MPPPPDVAVEDAYQVLRNKDRILVFTGAGLSTESGIPDFRGPDGLWTKVDPDDFTIQKYYASRELRVAKWRMNLDGHLWGARSSVQPNQGHAAIVDLHRAGRVIGVVTQNVDGLHHRSGLEDGVVAELHGNVRGSRCLDCAERWPTETVLEWVEQGEEDPHCPECGGLIKTDVVMFGESLPEQELDRASTMLAMADSILVVGSTVSVWPAAEIVVRGAHMSLPIVVINRGPTDADRLATVKIDAGIGEVLPGLVARIVA